MKVGFTGTRNGMTEAQKYSVRIGLERPYVQELHHGDCIGADAEADEMAHAIGLYVVIHPPLDETLRAFCRYANEVRPPLTHFARNRQIVDETDRLIATPATMQEEAFGGTWYTIRYARKRGKEVFVVWPDGKVLGPDGRTV